MKKLLLILFVVFAWLCMVGIGIFAFVMILGSDSDSVEQAISQDVSLEQPSSQNESPSTSTQDTEKPPTDNSESFTTDIEKFRVYTDVFGDLCYEGIVRVNNTGNKALYLGSARFDIEDESEHLISSDNFVSACPEIVSQGETGYYYTSGELPNESENGYVLVPDMKITASYEEPVNYEAFDVSVATDDPDHATIIGRVKNDTSEDCDVLYVRAILYGENGEVLDISGTNVLDLTAGGKVSFEITFYGTKDYTTSDIADYKIVAQKPSYQF